MTIYGLALARVMQCGMLQPEAEAMLEQFSRSGQGSQFDWGGIAPQLDRKQAAVIDGAAVGWRMRHGIPEPPVKPLPKEWLPYKDS